MTIALLPRPAAGAAADAARRWSRPATGRSREGEAGFSDDGLGNPFSCGRTVIFPLPERTAGSFQKDWPAARPIRTTLEGGAKFVCDMEDLLEVNHQDHGEGDTLVCLDETS